MTLKKLGKPLHTSKSSGNLIVKLESETKIGEPVMDPKGRRIGEVFDIFGPVDTPYASIKLKSEIADASKFQLYLVEDDVRTKKKRQNRRRSKGKR